MLKRTGIFFILMMFFLPQVNADSWDDFANVDRMWDGQKSITNKEFEQVMEKLEEKEKQKEEKQVKKKRKKLFGGGTTLHKELNPDDKLNEFESIKPKEEGIVLNVPVSLVLGKDVLEKGYYKVLPEHDEEIKKIYVSFYQSQFFKGKVEVVETEEDYGKETIDFAEIIPYNTSFVKLIFGSLDFNAYAYIPYLE